MTFKEVLLDEKQPAIALVQYVVREFSDEAFDWDPLILKDEIETKENIKLADIQLDKMQQGIMVLATDYFETDWMMFYNSCRILTGTSTDFDVIEPIDTEELVIGLADQLQIRHEDLDFDADIRKYQGTVFTEGGLQKPPSFFSEQIMPEGDYPDDKERQEYFDAIFNARLEDIVDYLEKIQT